MAINKRTPAPGTGARGSGNALRGVEQARDYPRGAQPSTLILRDIRDEDGRWQGLEVAHV